MSKIKIEFVEEFGIGEETRAAVELEGDGSADHWQKAVRGAMTLAGYHPDTIEEVFDQEVEPCCLGFGGTCSDDELRCPAGCCSGTAPALDDHVHADKVVEKLHGDDILAR